MKKMHNLINVVVCGLLISCSGCAYTSISRPLDTDFDKTELGAKVGRADSRVVFWLVAWGDSGAHAAAENGGLKVIKHADTEIYSILFGVYTRITTVVYGD